MLTAPDPLSGGRAPKGPVAAAFFEKPPREIPPGPRNRRSERVLAAGWVLIAVKCVAVWWVIRAHEVPVHPGWVIFPTLGAAALCSWLYWKR